MGTESSLKCPGLERALTIIPELFPCPCCGAEIEIWTDERKARCGRCGELISRESAGEVDFSPCRSAPNAGSPSTSTDTVQAPFLPDRLRAIPGSRRGRMDHSSALPRQDSS